VDSRATMPDSGADVHGRHSDSGADVHGRHGKITRADLARRITPHVNANNHVEGSAPLTIDRSEQASCPNPQRQPAIFSTCIPFP